MAQPSAANYVRYAEVHRLWQTGTGSTKNIKEQVIWTIGLSTRPIKEFLDVRAIAFSDATRSSIRVLQTAEITYSHFGCLRRTSEKSQ